MSEFGMIHIYCGDGKGKTSASVGLALRAAGSQKKVLFVQFFKDGTSSEIEVLRGIQNIDVLVEEKHFKFAFSLNEEEKESAKAAYQKLLEEAIKKASEYDMIVLDEIISTYNYEMINTSTLTYFLNTKPANLEIVMTGRDPKPELTECADYMTELKKIKHPYDKGVKARKGIEY